MKDKSEMTAHAAGAGYRVNRSRNSKSVNEMTCTGLSRPNKVIIGSKLFGIKILLIHELLVFGEEFTLYRCINY
jgi:hypothetical protein